MTVDNSHSDIQRVTPTEELVSQVGAVLTAYCMILKACLSRNNAGVLKFTAYPHVT